MFLAVLALVLAVPATARAAVFPDVHRGDWYHDGVNYCANHGLVSGYGDGRFGVGESLTRAQLATILWRNAQPSAAASTDASRTPNRTGMADVEPGTWYTAAANWAVSEGVISGYGTGGRRAFGPNDDVTFEQLLTILANYRAGGATGSASSGSLPFKDASSVSSWARSAVAWSVRQGLVSGYPNSDGSRSIRPQEHVTRERAAVVLANAGRKGVIDAGRDLSQLSFGVASVWRDVQVPEFGYVSGSLTRTGTHSVSWSYMRFSAGSGVTPSSVSSVNATLSREFDSEVAATEGASLDEYGGAPVLTVRRQASCDYDSGGVVGVRRLSYWTLSGAHGWAGASGQVFDLVTGHEVTAWDAVGISLSDLDEAAVRAVKSYLSHNRSLTSSSTRRDLDSSVRNSLLSRDASGNRNTSQYLLTSDGITVVLAAGDLITNSSGYREVLVWPLGGREAGTDVTSEHIVLTGR